MKKIVGVFFFAVIAFSMMSYSSSKGGGTGISFSKVSFEKAKKEASKSGKLIFIDAYTDWCGPCKRMAATTFKDREVGELFNDNFVNLKVEMEKTSDGKELSRLYRVRAYPTLLIVDDQGNLVKQLVGFQSKEKLIAFAESAL
ncbi:MAG: thioredoxin family protein [Crocinitomicaceae bacterium]|nr:thioredoxin family protein [Crocinitomicaceae bacterium]